MDRQAVDLPGAGLDDVDSIFGIMLPLPAPDGPGTPFASPPLRRCHSPDTPERQAGGSRARAASNAIDPFTPVPSAAVIATAVRA